MNHEAGEPYKLQPKDPQMLTAITVTVVIAVALGNSLRSGRRGEAGIRRPYNNRYNDATGARDESFD
jgi:hypothetical protein